MPIIAFEFGIVYFHAIKRLRSHHHLAHYSQWKSSFFRVYFSETKATQI